MSRIIRLPEVCQIVGLARSTVLRLESTGAFPPKLRLSERAIGWREADVRSWVESRQRPAVEVR